MCPSGQLLYLGCDSSKALRRNERSGLNDVGGGKSNGTLSLSFNILEKKKPFMDNNHANKPQNHHKNFAIASAHGDHHGVYPPYFDVS